MEYQGARISKFAMEGAVLWVVLVFCLILSLITHSMLQTAWLQSKIVSSYHLTQLALKEAEAKLIHVENKLKNKFYCILPEGIAFMQFIPDTLHFGETQGENVYAVKINLSKEDGTDVCLNSTVGIRKKQELSHEPDGQILAAGKNHGVRVSNNEENTVVSLIDITSGEAKREWILPDACDQFTIVDSLEQGFADRIYVGDKEGQLWRINIEDMRPKLIFRDRFRIKQFLGKPIVGRHLEGKGVIVYMIALNTMDELQLCAIKDEEEQNDSVADFLFVIEKFSGLSQPLLRQNRLIFYTMSAVYAYDAFTGLKLSEEKISYQRAVTNNLIFPIPIVNQKKPSEHMHSVIIFDETQMWVGKIYGEECRLGRKSWSEWRSYHQF